MDAGVCSACQNPLGQTSLEGMLGLFPRVRCGACGFVNVLSEGAAVAVTPPAIQRRNETVSLDDNPLYTQPEEEPAAPSYEEPSDVSAPAYESESEPEVPAFESAEEAPAYEDNVDYEQPALMHGAIPEEGEQEVPELPAESTRISIDPSEENNES
jgi:hypothetical protein